MEKRWGSYGIFFRGPGLRKMKENGVPGDPKSSQGLPKEAPGDAPEASRKGCRKNNDFQIPLNSENEAGAQARAQF